MPFTALAIGAGAGLLKAELVDKPQADRQRKLAAATQRYSPWTGLQAQPVKEADPVGSALSFGATGAQLGAGYQDSMAKKKLMEAQASWLDKNPYNFSTASTGVGSGMGSNVSNNALSGFNYNQNPTGFWGLQGLQQF